MYEICFFGFIIYKEIPFTAQFGMCVCVGGVHMQACVLSGHYLVVALLKPIPLIM